MKKRGLILLVALIFAFAQITPVYARSFGSSSRSFSSSSRSFSKSSGWSSSSSSTKKSSGWFGSSSSKSSSSSSGSSKSSGGWFGSGSSKGSSSASKSSGSSSLNSRGWTSSTQSKTSSQKSAYMEEQLKKQVSSSSYKTYNQKMNQQQQSVFDSALKNSYKTTRMDFDSAMRTKSSRINVFNSRPIFIGYNPVYFGSPFSYGYATVGPWDLWFLMRASELFWYHHWLEIQPYRDYFDQQKFAELESRVNQLEAQGVQRDPTYLEPGVDPDLQFSQQYLEKNPDSAYYTDKGTSPIGIIFTLLVIGAVAIVLIMLLRKISRKPRKSYSNKSWDDIY